MADGDEGLVVAVTVLAAPGHVSAAVSIGRDNDRRCATSARTPCPTRCRDGGVVHPASSVERQRRFLARIDEPEKNWKFSPADLRERALWDDYQRAFQDMLSHTSTDWAPWHVIPADHKWFSHLSTSAVLLETLRDLNPQYPQLDAAAKAELAQAKKELLGKDADAAARASS
jgi:hypothetical protein